MGQKTNPIGLRIAVNRDWRSKWYSGKKEFGKLLTEDRQIRELLKKKLESASVPQINIAVAEDKQNIILSVKDEGPGISKKHLENIFDKFYRVPGKQSTEVAGFGLGLFYVKKICDAHKWKITAASELDKGTTITVLIPKKYE